MRFAVVTLTLGILVQFTTLAADGAPQKVDQIFSVYEKAGSPGCSLGVIREGDFVYRKAYGSANLELGVPLSPQSVFYMGSVSKQFTAAAIVLAAEQGYLSLDDDVRKYVPELPDYRHVITLRQMLHQTSVLIDQNFDGAKVAGEIACIGIGLGHLQWCDLRIVLSGGWSRMPQTSVRDMIRAGVSEKVAMTVSGHKTHSMLSRYNIVSETDMRQALQRTGEYRKNALVEESKVVAMPARVQ